VVLPKTNGFAFKTNGFAFPHASRSLAPDLTHTLTQQEFEMAKRVAAATKKKAAAGGAAKAKRAAGGKKKPPGGAAAKAAGKTKPAAAKAPSARKKPATVPAAAPRAALGGDAAASRATKLPEAALAPDVTRHDVNWGAKGTRRNEDLAVSRDGSALTLTRDIFGWAWAQGAVGVKRGKHWFSVTVTRSEQIRGASTRGASRLMSALRTVR
jgi:hypothetical protein